jgi:hypothetical protein
MEWVYSYCLAKSYSLGKTALALKFFNLDFLSTQEVLDGSVLVGKSVTYHIKFNNSNA